MTKQRTAHARENDLRLFINHSKRLQAVVDRLAKEGEVEALSAYDRWILTIWADPLRQGMYDLVERANEAGTAPQI